MPAKKMIQIRSLCKVYEVEVSFIESLQQSGLIQVQQVGKDPHIPESELPQLEKIIRLYYDMQVNLEGIEVIHHLLGKMQALQQKMRDMQNRLQMYER